VNPKQRQELRDEVKALTHANRALLAENERMAKEAEQAAAALAECGRALRESTEALRGYTADLAELRQRHACEFDELRAQHAADIESRNARAHEREASQAKAIAALARELSELRAQDMDASVLRKRLQKRAAELDAAEQENGRLRREVAIAVRGRDEAKRAVAPFVPAPTVQP
jgi:hypothetical protein